MSQGNGKGRGQDDRCVSEGNQTGSPGSRPPDRRCALHSSRMPALLFSPCCPFLRKSKVVTCRLLRLPPLKTLQISRGICDKIRDSLQVDRSLPHPATALPFSSVHTHFFPDGSSHNLLPACSDGTAVLPQRILP